MSDSNPRILLAGEREAGAACVHCGRDIVLNDATAICNTCGAVHHLACWQTLNGCGAYECPDSRARVARSDLPVLTISSADLAAAVPLPPAPIRNFGPDPTPPVRPRNRLAVWSFIVALAGIPLFGLVTGLVAIVMSCIALAGHSPRRRGLPFAVAAMLIGLFDVVGWAVGMSMYLGGPGGLGGGGVALTELTIDPDSLKDLPERIARAMRANVLIESNFGLAGQGLGSGVILKVRDGSAYIVTNRHVIDHTFHDAAVEKDVDPHDVPPVEVVTVGQSKVPGIVEWIAPGGVDLAIISVHLGVDSDEVREAIWNVDKGPHIGDPVFAVGNPHGMGWSHSAGNISQVRTRTRGIHTFHILQSTAALNPGNSGGGLYDADGRLIGINTLTGDPRVSQGLGFSIAFSALLDLVPDTLGLLHENAAPAGEAPAAAPIDAVPAEIVPADNKPVIPVEHAGGESASAPASDAAPQSEAPAEAHDK